MQENILVVGAGFSKNAGLPLASSFTQELLDVSHLKPTGPSNSLVNTMRSFVNDLFGAGNIVPSHEWPQLEDLFTTIDLAANTGHNLGSSYSAADLRSIRRMIIIRLIRMLRSAYLKKKRKPDREWKLISRLFRNLDTDTTAFLSMNWDNVIEELLVDKQGPHDIDYGCSAQAATINRASLTIRPGRVPAKGAVVLKPHGSINWLYCDACSSLYWVLPKQVGIVASHLLKESDTNLIKRLTSSTRKASTHKVCCPNCGAAAMGTRFATFSYKKALEFPMHQATWTRAEEHLREARNWIFFGYSMPAADYQFKYLLKRVQLSRRVPPRIVVITAGSAAGATIDNFKIFFGSHSLRAADILTGGMDQNSYNHLKSLGVCV